MKKQVNTRSIAITGMLAAVASVLMYLDFPLPIFPSFLKFDFSDLPALIGAFAFGPMVGVAIELIKNLVHLLRTQTGGVGELANFIVGVALVLPDSLWYRRKHSKNGAIMGMVLGTLSMAVFGGLVNYFLIIPFYSVFMPMDAIIAACAKLIPAVDSLPKMILLTFVPFNVFKGVVISLVTFPVYKHLSRLFHK